MIDRDPMPHGSGSFRRLIERVSDTWKAIIVIFVAITAGFTFALSVTGFITLPETARDHERRIQRLESTSDEVLHGVDQLRCMFLADRQGQPIERCLETPRRP